VADILVAMGPAPFIGATEVMVWVPVVIFEPVVIVVVDLVEDIVCPLFELPPMANAWVARASAAITATVVNLFICKYLRELVVSVGRYSMYRAKKHFKRIILILHTLHSTISIDT
jgi:hypothetical protein